MSEQIRSLLHLALQEDIGRGDITTQLLVPEGLQARATVRVKQAACVAGLPLVDAVFHLLDPSVAVTHWVNDGMDVAAGTPVCEITGPARSILSGERTALNFLARLTGIATNTKRAVQVLEGTGVKLLDTRKTTPGWRMLEKYAVRMGGGHNHRYGLDDMVLIKDNHVALNGGVQNAIARARKGMALSQKLEVEVDTLSQLDAALEAGADLILLDNMDTATMREAVLRTAGRAQLEASGNMTHGRLREVAQTGVQYISMGALTHSAISVDVGLDIEMPEEAKEI
ncbi:carboxylating nicotinate-nucleotide diphosphorylase [Alicyclobacillus tolerans]|uniref:carboxylating nicotinate-nucleotide diphosphorylase n=1 Tax=Alicyclobacillus tolerans TaxID=90970 RepID=UPI001F00BF8E|nr:carboxylating nicotinate-nucleotide diphosphorylase [Alicyclobacillus tolerans]MCF8567099.1 carboxylating nicotinate-nucleotide diphosphorylase [Alicyclobacillus tolerans]